MKNEFFVFVGNMLSLLFRYFFGSLFIEQDISKKPPYVPYDFGNRSNLGAINQNDDDDNDDD